jgi:hypothetical protein
LIYPDGCAIVAKKKRDRQQLFGHFIQHFLIYHDGCAIVAKKKKTRQTWVYT